MYIIQATPTGHVLQTKLDIVTETTEQKQLLEAGYPLGPAMNANNFDPSDITESVAVDEREREFLKRTGKLTHMISHLRNTLTQITFSKPSFTTGMMIEL